MQEDKSLSGLVAANLESFNTTARELQKQMHQLELELVKVSANVRSANELENRVTALENWRWFVIGIATAAGAVSGQIIKMFGG